jgi:heme exporter protein CcmD
MSEWNFVVAAYALTWVTLAGFAVYVWRRARQAERSYEATDTRGGRP